MNKRKLQGVSEISTCEPNILILERKEYFGGRTRMFIFDEILTHSGAYGIRPHKDLYGMNLLQTLNIPLIRHNVLIDYTYVEKIDLLKTMDLLTSLITNENKDLNTKAFIMSTLGIDAYNKFIATAGRTDFEQECITDTIIHYGMDDNLSHEIIPVNWNNLWEELVKHYNIKYGIDVTDIVRKNNYIIIRSYNELFWARNIIIATDILTIRRLLPKHSIYHYI